MTDFSNLKKLDISADTEAEYTFRDIVLRLDAEGGEVYPTAFFAPAVDANAAFVSEKYRIATERAEQHKNEKPTERKRRLMSEDAEEEEREMMRRLISRACVRRWGENGMPDAKGKVHPLNEQECYDFLKALPIHMFTPLVNWITNPYNFFDRRAIAGDAATLGNSSPKDSSGS